MRITKETKTKTISLIREYSASTKNEQIKSITRKLKNKLQLDEVTAVKVNVILEIAFKMLRLGTLPQTTQC